MTLPGFPLRHSAGLYNPDCIPTNFITKVFCAALCGWIGPFDPVASPALKESGSMDDGKEQSQSFAIGVHN